MSARGPPLALTRMRVRPGAKFFWKPRTSKSKVSIFPPCQTVRPWPFMPTLISWTAMMGGGSAARTHGPARTANRHSVIKDLKGKGMRHSSNV